jgi:hypothetical protein
MRELGCERPERKFNMYNEVKFVYFRRAAPCLCGVLCCVVLALLPAPAKAQCAQWDVSGKWTLNVTKGITELLELKQNGNNVSGESHAYNDVVPVMGTVKGDDFSMSIDWTRPNVTFAAGVFPIEAFLGKIGSDGFIHGNATTLANLDLSAKGNLWSSDRPMRCVRGAESPRPKPIKSSGKARPSAPAPPSSPPPMKVPGIVASQTFFPVPGALTGLVGLSWDGGPVHPYAEVWVKVNNGAEIFVVEQGKGGRQITVQRGTLYEYILTDAGTTLATVRFVAN